jgi:hypothetical protein
VLSVETLSVPWLGTEGRPPAGRPFNCVVRLIAAQAGSFASNDGLFPWKP